MSASAFHSGTAPTLADSGYRGGIYHHVDLAKAPVMFMWWAKTPTGRQSKFWKTQVFERLRSCGKLTKHAGELVPVLIPSQHYGRSAAELYKWLRERGPTSCCPQLPRGYVWQGPFVYIDLEAPTKEGPTGPNWFAFKAPATSAGIPLGYVLDSTLQTAHTLAGAVLAARAGAVA